MSGKQWFALLSAAAVGIYLYQRLVNPRCSWCGAVLQAVAVGRALACPACGRIL